MKIALKIAYDGTQFFGFAAQPGLRTIEGELLENLEKILGVTHRHTIKIQAASRTDRGVSARGNVVTVSTPLPLKQVVYTLQRKLHEIWIVGAAHVGTGFNPRHATMRWYRYFLPTQELNVEKMRRASQVFLGEHNFTNFAKIEKKDPCLSIDTIRVLRKKNFIIIDMTAQHFLWNQVRRITAALVKVGNDEATVKELREALENPHQRTSFGNLPPENLLLMDIDYENLVFKDIALSLEHLEEITWQYRTRVMMFESMGKPPKF